MIRNIIGKEILKYLLSLRFMLSLLLIISLFATGGFMFVGKHRQESNDYWRDTNRNLSSLREHTNHLYELVTCQAGGLEAAKAAFYLCRRIRKYSS